MQAMMIFVSWFLSELPGFLLSEPISAFVGIWLLLWVSTLFWRMVGIHRR